MCMDLSFLQVSTRKSIPDRTDDHRELRSVLHASETKKTYNEVGNKKANNQEYPCCHLLISIILGVNSIRPNRKQ